MSGGSSPRSPRGPAGARSVAACDETAGAILQGPHGREVRAAVLSSWDPQNGPALIAAMRRCRPNLPIIALADAGSITQAVDAMRAGATDFLAKPVAPERLMDALTAHADRRRAAGELAPLSEKIAPELMLDQLVGSAPGFRAALAVAAKAARNRLPILIVGEPGTGKETFARSIHSASLRAKDQIVQVDCKSVAANIIDSELFGHMPGAFPGAFAERVGRIVEADGGTLLLDEVGALPRETQEKLDRVLATGEVRPVGCNGIQLRRYSLDRDLEPPACPAISCPAWPSGFRRRRSPCRRCASGAATSPPWPGTCCPASPRSRA